MIDRPTDRVSSGIRGGIRRCFLVAFRNTLEELSEEFEAAAARAFRYLPPPGGSCPKACLRSFSTEWKTPTIAPPFALRKPLSTPLSGELADPVHEVRRPPRRTPRRPFFSPAARPVSNDAGRLTLMALGAPEPTMTPKRSMQRVGVFSKHPGVRNLRTDRIGFRHPRPVPSGGVSKRHRTALSCVRAVTNAIGRQTLMRINRGFVDCRVVPRYGSLWQRVADDLLPTQT